MIEEVIAYKTDDGVVHETREQAERWHQRLMDGEIKMPQKPGQPEDDLDLSFVSGNDAEDGPEEEDSYEYDDSYEEEESYDYDEPAPGNRM